MRDIEINPYTTDEMKVVEYLTRIAPDVGVGDDPILFLIASHAELRRRLTQVRLAATGGL